MGKYGNKAQLCYVDIDLYNSNQNWGLLERYQRLRKGNI